MLIAEPPPTDRYNPVPPTTISVAHERVKLNQGGQRVRITIPATPGTNAFGDSFTYRWDTEVSGGARCQPGPLPSLANVTAGTVIDAPLHLPSPRRSRTLLESGRLPDPVFWSVSALLDDLLGPDGATEEADPYFDRAFKNHPLMKEHYEIDDNEFYGFPNSRKEAIAMAKLVNRVLRSGPYYGKTRPGRPR